LLFRTFTCTGVFEWGSGVFIATCPPADAQAVVPSTATTASATILVFIFDPPDSRVCRRLQEESHPSAD